MNKNWDSPWAELPQILCFLIIPNCQSGRSIKNFESIFEQPPCQSGHRASYNNGKDSLSVREITLVLYISVPKLLHGQQMFQRMNSVAIIICSFWLGVTRSTFSPVVYGSFAFLLFSFDSADGLWCLFCGFVGGGDWAVAEDCDAHRVRTFSWGEGPMI